MPIYKNETPFKIVSPVGSVSTNESVTTNVFVNHEQLGLTMIDENPMYNPIVFSRAIEKKTVIKVPYADSKRTPVERFQIHFYQEKKTSKVNFNSEKNEPTLLLYESARWNTKCYERVYDTIIVDVEEGGKLYMIIERI